MMKKTKKLLLSLMMSSLFVGASGQVTAPVTSGCNSVKVEFSNPYPASSYSWDFGNGNTSAVRNPSAVYNTPGKYTVRLITHDSTGDDTFTYHDMVTVFVVPKASFAGPTSLCAGSQGSFFDNTKLGDAPIRKYTWDFGDGQLANGQQTTHAYKSAGTYDVTLSVTDTNGCTSNARVTDYVAVSALPNFTAWSDGSQRCKAPYVVGLSSNTVGNGPFDYYWYADSSVFANTGNTYYSVQSNEKKLITLKVVDSRGCTAHKPVATIEPGPPKASFTMSGSKLCQGDAVQFWNNSVPNNQKFTDSVVWDFGDGYTSKDWSPSHKFTTAGKFRVAMTYHYDGCSSSASDTVTVYPTPGDFITPRDQVVCRDDVLKVQLGVNTKLDDLSWGIVGRARVRADTLQTFYVSRKYRGRFLVYAKGTSPYGCGTGRDTVSIEVIGPRPFVYAGQKGGCLPYSTSAWAVVETDRPIVKYEWSCPNLNVYSNKEYIDYINVNKFGNSLLLLTVTDDSGCQGVGGLKLGAGIRPDASFDVSKKDLCSHEPFDIINNSVQTASDTVMFTWSWFGKDTIPLKYGRMSNLVRFRTKPSDSVKLTFTSSSYGCTAQDSTFVRIRGPYIDGVVDVSCVMDSVWGTNLSTEYTKTVWTYVRADGTERVDTALKTSGVLSDTRWLAIKAYNDSTMCADSIYSKPNADPQSTEFDAWYDCEDRLLYTNNKYKGLFDTLFTWTVRDANGAVVHTRKDIDIDGISLPAGRYDVTLEAHNKEYVCTAPSTKSVFIADRTSVAKAELVSGCGPYEIALSDTAWGRWTDAYWTVEGQDYEDDGYVKVLAYEPKNSRVGVKLTRVDESGCLWVDSMHVRVGEPSPRAAVSIDHSDCSVPVLVLNAVDDNQLPGVKYEYSWTVNGKDYSASSLRIQFPGGGTANYRLGIKSSLGCTGDSSGTIDVPYGKPLAGFKSANDTLSSCPPLRVSMTDTSSTRAGQLTSWTWMFGDGSGSEKRYPSKLYVVPGKYTVTLVVTNSVGCKDTAVSPEMAVVRGANGHISVEAGPCSPSQALVSIWNTGGLYSMGVDMGDGTVYDGPVTAHVYGYGKFIPRITMVDTFGCEYSPPPKDTILVHETPIASSSVGNACLGDTVFMHGTSSVEGATITWSVDGLQTDDRFVPTRRGNMVAAFVADNMGCADTSVSRFKAYGVETSLELKPTKLCLGDTLILDGDARLDTTLVSVAVYAPEAQIHSSWPPALVASTRGVQNALVVTTDALGCTDTVELARVLMVGDTLEPYPVDVVVSTVNDDMGSTLTEFVPSTEPDFDRYEVWVDGLLVDSNYDASADRFVVSGLDPLHRSYGHVVTQRNFCGVASRSREHYTVELRAAGDTNSSVLAWNPYVGWDTVEAYAIMRSESGLWMFSYIDSVPGTDTSYVDTSVLCHRSYDYRVVGLGRSRSYSDTANATPVHHAPVNPPVMTRVTVDDGVTLVVEWQPPSHRYPIHVYSVYRDGERIDETAGVRYVDSSASSAVMNTYTVTATDACETTSPESGPGRNVVVTASKYNDDQDPVVSWTRYHRWEGGVERYEVSRSTEGEGFVTIGSVPGDDTSYVDYGIPRECTGSYRYMVTAFSNAGVESQSNYDAYSPDIRFYVPNAFTPDGNRLNEVFRPSGVFYRTYSVRIYDRWGGKVYDGDGCGSGWDGDYMGRPAPDGVYAVLVTATDSRGVVYNFTGTVTLLR